MAAISVPSASTIADAVWNEPIADHQSSGSTGEALTAAGGGTTPASIWGYGQRTLTGVGGLVTELGTDWIAAAAAATADFEMFYGDSEDITATVTDGTNAIDLTNMDIYMAITDNEDDDWDSALVKLTSNPASGITVNNPSGGEFTISFTDAQLALLTIGTRWYTIKREDSAGDRKTLIAGVWKIKSATDLGLAL